MMKSSLHSYIGLLLLPYALFADPCNFTQHSHPMPKIIYLNGPSSSGKSTIARALQDALQEPYLLIDIDKIIGMMPPKLNNWEGGPAPLGYSWQSDLDETGHSIKTLSIGPYAQKMEPLLRELVCTTIQQGHNVIIDDVVFGKSEVDKWRDTLKGYRVLWIGIIAPLSVLEKREKERPDRIVGSARAQAAIVHKGVTYDLEFDTSKSSINEIVTAIKTKAES